VRPVYWTIISFYALTPQKAIQLTTSPPKKDILPLTAQLLNMIISRYAICHCQHNPSNAFSTQVWPNGQCPTLAVWLVVPLVDSDCNICWMQYPRTAKPQKSNYIFIQATGSHTENAFVLKLEAAYYHKYVVEVITASRQYTIRDTATSSSCS
jgi:hypothetical protein